MKTIKEWLKEGLNRQDYEKAEQYENEKWDWVESNFRSALLCAFDWTETKEGVDYWSVIHFNGSSLQTKLYAKPDGANLLSIEIDPVVEAVCKDLMDRSAVGFKKYDIADLSDKESLQHAYEEALDLVNHLKILITKQNEHDT